MMNPVRGTLSTEVGPDSFDDINIETLSTLLTPENIHRDSLLLFTLSYFWTLFMTGLPVAFNVGPERYYAHHYGWYSGNDVIRFMEPVGGLIINFMLVYRSGIFKKDLSPFSTILIVFFFFGVALYEQGAGFHSAANMFKNGMQTIDFDDRDMKDMYYWMRNIWEHIVSHYLYATGYAIMTGVQCYLYKDFKAPHTGLPIRTKIVLIITSILFALLIAGVAADFPSGLIVALVFLILYGLGVVGGYVFYLHRYVKEKNALVFGSRPFLHHFLLSYVLALFFVLIYIASVGGLSTRSEAGIQ